MRPKGYVKIVIWIALTLILAYATPIITRDITGEFGFFASLQTPVPQTAAPFRSVPSLYAGTRSVDADAVVIAQPSVEELSSLVRAMQPGSVKLTPVDPENAHILPDCTAFRDSQYEYQINGLTREIMLKQALAPSAATSGTALTDEELQKRVRGEIDRMCTRFFTEANVKTDIEVSRMGRLATVRIRRFAGEAEQGGAKADLYEDGTLISCYASAEIKPE